METATLSYGFFHLPSEEQGEPFHAIKETENYIRDRKTRGEKCYREVCVWVPGFDKKVHSVN